MGNRATVFLADYMKQHNISPDVTAARLSIPREKLTASSTEPLMADELLRLCAYLNIRPELVAEQVHFVL